MSLIKCPECDHNVSSKAPFCPNCGVLIEGNIKRCPVCGGYSLMAATQCPHCKTKFAPQSIKAVATEQTGDPATDNVGTANVQGAAAVPAPAERPTTNADAASGTEVPAQPGNATPLLVDPRVQQSKGSGAPWYLLILAIVFICIGGFFYWENQNQEASEERAYEQLRDCNNPLSYEDFISRYPSSRHIDDVRRRLEELHKEDALWHSISVQSDVALFKDFIAKHPTSPYKKVALHKIDSLDWRAAERAGSSAAYDAYIQSHDNGEYIDNAFTARDAAMRREEQARRDSIAAVAARQRDSIASVTPPDVVAPI